MAKAELIKQQERDLLDTRSQPIRQYLMDNLVPFLTQGLIELCKKVPQDPVDNLADFLLKKADEIDNKKIKDREAVLKAKLDAAQRELESLKAAPPPTPVASKGTLWVPPAALRAQTNLPPPVPLAELPPGE